MILSKVEAINKLKTQRMGNCATQATILTSERHMPRTNCHKSASYCKLNLTETPPRQALMAIQKLIKAK